MISKLQNPDGLKRRKFFALIGASGLGAWMLSAIPFRSVRAFSGSSRRKTRPSRRPVQVRINPLAVKRNRKGQ